jgi:cytochrome c-type biogenesis protein CcmH/NrfG
LVRSIVVDTINKLVAAGQPIGNAKSFLTKGDQYLAAKKYKDAYDSYRQAYRTATGH